MTIKQSSSMLRTACLWYLPHLQTQIQWPLVFILHLYSEESTSEYTVPN